MLHRPFAEGGEPDVGPRAFQYARGGGRGLHHEPLGQLDIGSVADADWDAHENVARRIGPVEDLLGHQDPVWDQMFLQSGRRAVGKQVVSSCRTGRVSLYTKKK